MFPQKSGGAQKLRMKSTCFFLFQKFKTTAGNSNIFGMLIPKKNWGRWTMNPFFTWMLFFKWVDWFNHQLFTVVKTWGSWCVLFFLESRYKDKKTVCRCQFLVEFSEPKPGFVYLKATLWVGSNVGSTKISSRSENFHELRGLRQPSWLFKWTGRLENDGRWFSSWQAVKLKQHDCFIASFWQAFFSWRHLFAERSYYCPTANLFTLR